MGWHDLVGLQPGHELGKPTKSHKSAASKVEWLDKAGLQLGHELGKPTKSHKGAAWAKLPTLTRL